MAKTAQQPLARTASPPTAARSPGREYAIDTVHLSRMTLGDRSLEFEVLELFERQAELLLARMNEVPPAGVATLAHTLTGSARGIGAWRVAEAAEELERAVREKPDLVTALARLATAVEEARLTIGGLLKDVSPA